jgi:hypothetical protein
MGAGAVAGCLGALLGIGGGVFLVPFVDVVLGLGLSTARGISLMTVIATSSVVAAGASSRPLINLRLAMVLLIAASAGGMIGGITVPRLSESLLSAIFAVVTAFIAIIMMTRLDRRNVIMDKAVDPGRLGGRFHEDESGGEVVYRLKRLPSRLWCRSSAAASPESGIGGAFFRFGAQRLVWRADPRRRSRKRGRDRVTAAASNADLLRPRRYRAPPRRRPSSALPDRSRFWIGAARARGKLLMATVLAIMSLISEVL